MTKILLVEDDETIAFGIKSALKRKGYMCTSCASAGQAKDLFAEGFQLILLDLNLPDGSGYDFCKWVKEREDTPVIFLTVCDDVKDITRGLDMGADDYVTKPFHIAVLESRIAAVLRRTSDDGGNVLSCGNIQLDREKMQVMVDGQSVDATALEYRLLEVLMENKGRTLPRNLILDKLWDTEGNFVNDNTLTVTVKRLRRKLMDTGYIVTIRGIGYRMEEKI
ncbi:response regulator transcription factor [Muricomes sp. OA1]|uniref:Stage 0 sporulation protein A homolog n=3 Tax=Lachnospiraceae TaxID=186803 RepID=A0A3E2WZT9_9FIRM|nr:MULTISPECIES: response regulator transcription factor [Clostridia]MEE0200371.1 response regulator transcription factor [Muricomes sp.]MCH1974865.1 response regulator transcription factor [Muricomes sp. OA1]MRM88380.1 DNA-binding response regulator [Faecalicatena contorta]RGC34153.1 DNA-binding response regulator [Hungatella hathewayi]GKH33655.1 DNA-binding response regulator [Faecalicatena contorta]